MSVCHPIAWYWPTGSSGAIPCKWLVRIPGSGSCGSPWIVVELWMIAECTSPVANPPSG